MNQTIEEVLSPELTEAENQYYARRARELAVKYGVLNVYPVVFILPENKQRIECFLKEPSFEQEVKTMQQAMDKGAYLAANILREAITLKKESHPLCVSDSVEAKRVLMGVNDYCLGLVKRLCNQYKK